MMTAFDAFGEAETDKEAPQIVKADVGVRSALENPKEDRLAHSTIMDMRDIGGARRLLAFLAQRAEKLSLDFLLQDASKLFKLRSFPCTHRKPP